MTLRSRPLLRFTLVLVLVKVPLIQPHLSTHLLQLARSRDLARRGTDRGVTLWEGREGGGAGAKDVCGVVRLVCHVLAVLATSPFALVLADARSAALLAHPSNAVVFADARPAAFLAAVSFAVVLADARPAALLARGSFAVVLADARPAALLAHASDAVVLADARPAALLATASYAVVLADARPAAFLAPASSAVVLADARPTAFLAAVPLAVVLAYARTAALLAPPSFAVVLAHARAAALHARDSSSVVLADARPAAFLALAFLAVVLADVPPATFLAPVSSSVVLALFVVGRARTLYHRDSSRPRPAHTLSTLLLLCRAACVGHKTLSLLHGLLFPLAPFPFLLVFGHFPLLVLELLDSLTARPLFAPPSIACVAKATFPTHFLTAMPDPAFKPT